MNTNYKLITNLQDSREKHLDYVGEPNEKPKNVTRYSDLCYFDTFATTKDTYNPQEFYKFDATKSIQRNSIISKVKERSISVEPKRLIQRKLPLNSSKYESKLSYYANLLNDFKESKPKISKETHCKSKIISNRGLFSSSPPKISSETPYVDMKKLIDVAKNQRKLNLASIHIENNHAASNNLKPFKYLIKSRIETTESFTVPATTHAITSNDICNLDEVVSYEIGIDNIYLDVRYRDSSTLGSLIINKYPWRLSEDQKLIHFYTKYQDNWEKISSFFEKHNENECRNRFNYLQQSKIEAWSPEELKKLISLHSKHGNNWKTISSQFKDRTPTQIKDKMRSLNRLKLNVPSLFQNIINAIVGTKNLLLQDNDTCKSRDHSHIHGIGTMEGPISIKDIVKLRNIQHDISDSCISEETKFIELKGDYERKLIDPKLERIEFYKKALKELANFSKN